MFVTKCQYGSVAPLNKSMGDGFMLGLSYIYIYTGMCECIKVDATEIRSAHFISVISTPNHVEK